MEESKSLRFSILRAYYSQLSFLYFRSSSSSMIEFDDYVRNIEIMELGLECFCKNTETIYLGEVECTQLNVRINFTHITKIIEKVNSKRNETLTISSILSFNMEMSDKLVSP